MTTKPKFKTREEHDAYYRAKYYADTDQVAGSNNEPLTLQVPAAAVPVLATTVKAVGFGMSLAKAIWHALALLMVLILLAIVAGIVIS